MERAVHRAADPSSPWDKLAHSAASALGDVAVVTHVVAGLGILEVVAVCHRRAEHERIAKQVIGEKYRPGEGLPGRVWESERGILLLEVDRAALIGLAPHDSKRYVSEVGLQSMIIVPLRQGGHVIGTLGVARDPGGPPYTEDEFDLLTAIATIAVE